MARAWLAAAFWAAAILAGDSGVVAVRGRADRQNMPPAAATLRGLTPPPEPALVSP